jgi:hypothetical protein
MERSEVGEAKQGRVRGGLGGEGTVYNAHSTM